MRCLKTLRILATELFKSGSNTIFDPIPSSIRYLENNNASSFSNKKGKLFEVRNTFVNLMINPKY